MKVDASVIKQLRTETGMGVMDCKKALEEAGGNLEKAKTLLKQRGVEIAAKKGARTARNGAIASYVHTGGKIGVLVEVNCETDFVARNELFQNFARNICLQVTAANPVYLKTEDVPEALLTEQKRWCEEEVKDKPGAERDKILTEKIDNFYREKVLLKQVFIREPEKTIQEYLDETIARTGEKIVIRRFVRLELGAE